MAMNVIPMVVNNILTPNELTPDDECLLSLSIHNDCEQYLPMMVINPNPTETNVKKIKIDMTSIFVTDEISKM